MKQNSNTYPDYKAIFIDILHHKFPDKIEECLPLLDKKKLSALDILNINNKIFGWDEESVKISKKHCSYKRYDIFKILDYQKTYELNNCQLAKHFKLSRNTIAKWKKIFI